MKLRLVSRLLVLALIVVVGLIIIIHQQVIAGDTPHPTQPTPTVNFTVSETAIAWPAW